MSKREICNMTGCFNLARYPLYQTDSKGNKKWLHVCSLHEQIIGGENMRRAGSKGG